jgi:hypothetical protein
MRRYTDDEIRLMRELVGYGYSGKQIAAKLGRDPLAIRAKMVALGLPLRPPKVNRERLRIVIHDELWRGLQRAADERVMTVPRLARELLETVIRDEMVGAVLDLPLPKRIAKPVTLPKRSRAPVLPPFAPVRRSPSQCPGTARSSTSAGRSRMETISTICPCPLFVLWLLGRRIRRAVRKCAASSFFSTPRV